MERHILDVKNAYAAALQAENKERAREILESDEYSPITKLIQLTEDEEPNTEWHNIFLGETNIDLNVIDHELANTALGFHTLYEFTLSELAKYVEYLNKEREMQKDLQMLCGAYTDFDTIKLIESYDDQFYKLNNNVYCAAVKEHIPITLNVVSVDGNGFEGNKYVKYLSGQNYKDSSSILNTANRSYIVSDNQNQYYEYSRLTGNVINFSAVNKDFVKARCSIVLESPEIINAVSIKTTQRDLVLSELFVSDDNILYTQVNAIHNLVFNDDTNKYVNGNYIYNSGIISFPDSKYIKLVFESGSPLSNEIIGYEQAKVDENGQTYQQTTICNDVLRHVIKINQISAFKAVYKTENSYTINNILDNINPTSINAVAIFCNEYIPDHFNSKEFIQYYLTINDKTYQMAPINSDKNHTKIIKISKNALQLDYVKYISEPIRNISLKVVLKTPDEYSTPFISNLKVLYGLEQDY